MDVKAMSLMNRMKTESVAMTLLILLFGITESLSVGKTGDSLLE